jgi:hypothetical protein
MFRTPAISFDIGALGPLRESEFSVNLLQGRRGDFARKRPFECGQHELFAAKCFIPRAPIHNLAMTSAHKRAGPGDVCHRLIQIRTGCLTRRRTRGHHCIGHKNYKRGALKCGCGRWGLHCNAWAKRELVRNEGAPIATKLQER